MKYKIWNDTKTSVPTIYIHSFVGNGEDVWNAAHHMNCQPFNLVTIYDFNGDVDLSPWTAENVWKGQPPFAGKAKEHLREICEELIPEVESLLPAPSAYMAMAGYSLAGLFTFWTGFQTDIFNRIACISASFWYPDFVAYVQSHDLLGHPHAIYFSLGDKESKTKHPLMKQVEERTQDMVEYVKELQIPTVFEMNPGNHFKDSDKRTARAIQWLLEQK